MKEIKGYIHDKCIWVKYLHFFNLISPMKPTWRCKDWRQFQLTCSGQIKLVILWLATSFQRTSMFLIRFKKYTCQSGVCRVFIGSGSSFFVYIGYPLYSILVLLHDIIINGMNVNAYLHLMPNMVNIFWQLIDVKAYSYIKHLILKFLMTFEKYIH